MTLTRLLFSLRIFFTYLCHHHWSFPPLITIILTPPKTQKLSIMTSRHCLIMNNHSTTVQSQPIYWIFESTSTNQGPNYDHHHILHDDQQNLLPDQYYQISEVSEQYFVPSKPFEYYEKPKPEGKESVVSPTKSPYNNGEPKSYDQVHQRHYIPTVKYIPIRGLVLCNSGQSYVPLQGMYPSVQHFFLTVKRSENEFESIYPNPSPLNC